MPKIDMSTYQPLDNGGGQGKIDMSTYQPLDAGTPDQPQSPANSGSSGDVRFGSSLGDMISTPIQHIGQMFSGPYHAFTDPATDVERKEFNAPQPSIAGGGDDKLGGILPHISLGVKRMFVDPTTTALSQIGRGNTFEQNLQHAEDAIPIVGPWAHSIEDEVRNKGAVAGIEGLMTDALAPVAAAKGLGGAMGVAGRGAEIAAATPEARALAITRAIVPGTPESLLSRALKPSVAYPDFEESVHAGLPRIWARSPQGVSGFADASAQAAKDLHGQFERLKAPYVNDPIDTTPMVKPQVQSIPAMNKFETPQIIDATKARAAAYDMTPSTKTVTSPILDPYGKPIVRQITTQPARPTLNTVDAIRQDSNAKLNDFWNKSKGDRNAARSNPETARTEAVNNSARDVVYKYLSKKTGVPEKNIRADQKLYGHLTDVADVAGKRSTVFGRQNPMSLQETLAATPGHPVSGALDFIGQRLLKNATGSDALVNSALDRFANPAGTPLTPGPTVVHRIGSKAGTATRAAGRVAGRIRPIGVASTYSTDQSQ